MPLTSLGGSEKSSLRRREIRETFGGIIDIVKRQNADLLLISGDLYEHNYTTKSTISFINSCFEEIPGTKVFILPGNHDPYAANSYYASFKWSANVNILTPDNPYYLLEDMEACIYGMGFNSSYDNKPWDYGIKAINTDLYNILLAHGTVDMEISRNAYNPMRSENLDSLGMDYIALGHFHNTMEGVGRRHCIYNPGSPEPLGFDETGEHGIFTGGITRQKNGQKLLEVSFVKTNKRYYENLEINISGLDTDEQVITRISNILDNKDAAKGLFCITLKGYLEAGFKVDTQLVKSKAEEIAFFVKVKDETVVDYNFNDIMNEPGLKGLFTSKIFARIGKTEDEYEKRLLLKALYYGIEAIEKGEIKSIDI